MPSFKWRAHWAAATGLVLLLGCSNQERRTEFLAARQLIVEGNHEAGAKALESYLEKHPDSKYNSRAGLFLGKAHLAMDDMREAEKWFQWTVDHHGATLEGHKCRYKLAWCDYLAGRREEALRQFSALAEEPDGPLAAEATAWKRHLSAAPAQQPAPVGD